jgi:hypothetical protein
VVYGPSYGYFPEPTKSILITSPANKFEAELHFADLGFKVRTGHRYLGGFVGDEEIKQEW